MYEFKIKVIDANTIEIGFLKYKRVNCGQCMKMAWRIALEVVCAHCNNNIMYGYKEEPDDLINITHDLLACEKEVIAKEYIAANEEEKINILSKILGSKC